MGCSSSKDFKKEQCVEYLNSWGFPDVFDEIDREEMERAKKFMADNRIDRNLTGDLNQYIQNIKNNVDVFKPC